MKIKEYSIPSDYNEVAPVCKEIRSVCLEENVKITDCNEIEICLIEALNNIIKHAYKEEFTKCIKITVRLDKKVIALELTDEGFSRKDFKKPTLDYDPKDIEKLPEGGMGLYIIDQLMDKTSYHTTDGSNSFIMEKYLA